MTSFVGNHGLLAVFILMFVAAILPAASELTMVYGGALASGALSGHIAHFRHGFHAYLAVVVVGVVANVLGAAVGWAIGYYGGQPLLERHGRWFHLSPAKLDRAEAWFERWGNLGVALGRITPIVRSFVSIPAGVFEMPLVPYTLLTLVGSAIWAFALAGAGYALGTSYHGADHAFRYLEYAVVAGVVLLAAYLVYRWRTGAKVDRRADDPAR